MSKRKCFVAGWISGGLVSAAIVTGLNIRRNSLRERRLLMRLQELLDSCVALEHMDEPPF